MYGRIQELDAEVLAISVDNLSGAEDVVNAIGIPFPVLYDVSRQVPRTYGVYNLLGDNLAAPATFIVDRDGEIVWKYVAGSKGDRPSVSTILSRLGG